ncbi:hypothetical protein GOBAR_DD15958 [Gossypium barbadense]|nr:hypothetical protein GOBAR_DD15958 [Gossypium barbadense]
MSFMNNSIVNELTGWTRETNRWQHSRPRAARANERTKTHTIEGTKKEGDVDYAAPMSEETTQCIEAYLEYNTMCKYEYRKAKPSTDRGKKQIVHSNVHNCTEEFGANVKCF